MIMKHLFKVSTFALLLCSAMISCQEDEVVYEKANSGGSNSVQLVEITGKGEVVPITRNSGETDGNYALKFASEKVYRETVAQLKQMNETERLAFTSSLGLISLQNLLSIADDELETIGAKATDKTDFRVKYKAYKEKYSEYFIFNSVDDLDLSPYMPDGDETLSYLVGKNRIMVIGDKIEEVNFVRRMGESDSLLFASGIEAKSVVTTRSLPAEKKWPENNFIEYPFDGKKTTFSFTPIGITKEFKLHLGAQKKMWYGWKKDPKRNFYLKFGVSNFQYVISGAAGHPVWTNSPEYIYSFLGAKGKVNMTIGRGTGGDVKGNAYVWTDQTIEKDAKGNVAIEVVNRQNYPKGDIEKSLPCLLNWPHDRY